MEPKHRSQIARECVVCTMGIHTHGLCALCPSAVKSFVTLELTRLLDLLGLLLLGVARDLRHDRLHGGADEGLAILRCPVA